MNCFHETKKMNVESANRHTKKHNHINPKIERYLWMIRLFEFSDAIIFIHLDTIVVFIHRYHDDYEYRIHVHVYTSFAKKK